MASASWLLMPRRALHTWQMRLLCRLRSLICCSSQKPISRRRWEISGEAESCLMRTAVPATTRLNGQRNGSFVQPFSPKQLDMNLFTCRVNLMAIETELQEGLFIGGARTASAV